MFNIFKKKRYLNLSQARVRILNAQTDKHLELKCKSYENFLKRC